MSFSYKAADYPLSRSDRRFPRKDSRTLHRSWGARLPSLQSINSLTMEAMHSPVATPSAWATSLFPKTDTWMLLSLGVTLAFLLATFYRTRRPSRKLPYVNSPSFLDFFAAVPRKRFIFNARSIFASARAQYPGQPYRLMTDTGENIVIPANLVHSIRNEPGLSFVEAFADNFHPHLPGFESMREIARPSELFIIVIKKHITKLLSQWFRRRSPLQLQDRGTSTRCSIADKHWPGSQTRLRSLSLSKRHMPFLASSEHRSVSR